MKRRAVVAYSVGGRPEERVELAAGDTFALDLTSEVTVSFLRAGNCIKLCIERAGEKRIITMLPGGVWRETLRTKVGVEVMRSRT